MFTNIIHTTTCVDCHLCICIVILQCKVGECYRVFCTIRIILSIAIEIDENMSIDNGFIFTSTQQANRVRQCKCASTIYIRCVIFPCCQTDICTSGSQAQNIFQRTLYSCRSHIIHTCFCKGIVLIFQIRIAITVLHSSSHCTTIFFSANVDSCSCSAILNNRESIFQTICAVQSQLRRCRNTTALRYINTLFPSTAFYGQIGGIYLRTIYSHTASGTVQDCYIFQCHNIIFSTRLIVIVDMQTFCYSCTV